MLIQKHTQLWKFATAGFFKKIKIKLETHSFSLSLFDPIS